MILVIPQVKIDICNLKNKKQRKKQKNKNEKSNIRRIYNKIT